MDYTGHIKVSKVGVSSRVQECVGRLYVSVDNTLLSQVLESKTELCNIESYASY